MRPNVASRLVLLSVVLVQAASAQGLGSEEFESRRRQLRQQFLDARTPEAKQAVLEEFRRLELRIHPRASGGDRESVGRLFRGEDSRVVDALAAGMNPRPSTTGASASSTGLGTTGSRRPDPRVQQLEELIRATEYELSDQLLPEYQYLIGDQTRVAPGSRTTLDEASREVIREYPARRQELQTRLDAGRRELEALRQGRTSAWPASLEDWTHLLRETGASRRLMAGWLRTRWAHAIDADRATLTRLRATLVRQRQGLDRIRQAELHGRSVHDWANFTMTLERIAGAVEDLTDLIETPLAIVNAAVNQIYEQLEPSNDIVDSGFRILTEMQTRRTAIFEDAESAEDQLRQISTTVRRIREALDSVDSNAHRMERARFQETVPILPIR